MNRGAPLPQTSSWALSVRPRASAEWDAFLAARPEATFYLQSGWVDLVREVFGHRTAFIEARNACGKLEGVLPIVQQKSLLLGNFATSLPFCNYGGAECESDELALLLMSEARGLAREWGCRYLELRDARPRSDDWLVRKDKVTMILPLPPSFDVLAKQLGSKLRSQVKRAEREDVSIRIGGAELVEYFYGVFAENMRELGTPVYPRRFFHAIVDRFPDCVHLVVVSSRGRPAAAAFLIASNGRAEIPWAACSAAAKPLGFNMKLYWEVLRYVTELGCTRFDFGRSTIEAGTYRFKKQWGAQPVQLYWHRWERDPGRRQISDADDGIMQYASRAWQKLPLGVANVLGPWLSPKLPW